MAILWGVYIYCHYFTDIETETLNSYSSSISFLFQLFPDKWIREHSTIAQTVQAVSWLPEASNQGPKTFPCTAPEAWTSPSGDTASPLASTLMGTESISKNAKLLLLVLILRCKWLTDGLLEVESSWAPRQRETRGSLGLLPEGPRGSGLSIRGGLNSVLPQNSCLPGSSECDFIWKYGLCRCN